MKKDAQNEEKLIAKEKLYKIKLAKKNLKIKTNLNKITKTNLQYKEKRTIAEKMDKNMPKLNDRQIKKIKNKLKTT